jgi:hypothetical protein
MKKYYLIFTVIFSVLFLFGCDATNTLKVSFNTDASTLKNRIKEIALADNYKIETENALTLVTEWRLATKDENNIPDNTIETKLEITISPTMSGSEILLKVIKRSSLNSTDPETPTYSDIGVIMNDLLYKKWDHKLKSLQSEYKK